MYALVAYRPNGDDYCMGCHMGSSSSELSITYHKDIETLAEKYLEIQKQEFEDRNDREIMAYEYTVLCEGQDIFDINPEFHTEVFEELNRLTKEDTVMWQRAEEDAKALKQQQERNKQRQHDLAELARIQARLSGAES